MATTAELQKRIAELEATLARAEILSQISRGVNAASDEDELLHALLRLALEAGARSASLNYIDLDEAGEPEWLEVIAIWDREGEPPNSVGDRFYLPEFPLSSCVWMASPDEPPVPSPALSEVEGVVEGSTDEGDWDAPYADSPPADLTEV